MYIFKEMSFSTIWSSNNNVCEYHFPFPCEEHICKRGRFEEELFI